MGCAKSVKELLVHILSYSILQGTEGVYHLHGCTTNPFGVLHFRTSVQQKTTFEVLKPYIKQELVLYHGLP